MDPVSLGEDNVLNRRPFSDPVGHQEGSDGGQGGGQDSTLDLSSPPLNKSISPLRLGLPFLFSSKWSSSHFVLPWYWSLRKASKRLHHIYPWAVGSKNNRSFPYCFGKNNWYSPLHYHVRSTPVLPQWHVKDSGHSAKRAGWKLHLKHAYTLDPTKSEWADYAAVQLTRNLSGNIRPQSSQLAEPLWTDPGIKSGTSVRELISTSKK